MIESTDRINHRYTGFSVIYWTAGGTSQCAVRLEEDSSTQKKLADFKRNTFNDNPSLKLNQLMMRENETLFLPHHNIDNRCISQNTTRIDNITDIVVISIFVVIKFNIFQSKVVQLLIFQSIELKNVNMANFSPP